MEEHRRRRRLGRWRLRVAALGVSRSVVDEFNRVGASCVLRLWRVVEVGHAIAVEDGVFGHRTVLAGGGECWLVFF